MVWLCGWFGCVGSLVVWLVPPFSGAVLSAKKIDAVASLYTSTLLALR